MHVRHGSHRICLLPNRIYMAEINFNRQFPDHISVETHGNAVEYDIRRDRDVPGGTGLRADMDMGLLNDRHKSECTG